MTIDILFFILMAFAVYKGYSRGFIVAVFSFLAIIIGLAAALKFSALVAVWLSSSTNIGTHWLPFISFAIVMIGAVLLIRLVANLLQKMAEFVLMGWANKIGGMLLYACIYTTLLSVVLFYARQMGLLKHDTITASTCYPFIQPWGITLINGFGKIIPIFKDLFTQLETFFDGVNKHVTV